MTGSDELPQRRDTPEVPSEDADAARARACDDEFAAYNEWCWTQVSDNDLRELLRPVPKYDPCPWCGGRTCHNPLCLRVLDPAQDVRMDFGKHKGMRVEEVPDSYLRWMLKSGVGSSDIRPAVADECRARDIGDEAMRLRYLWVNWGAPGVDSHDNHDS